MRSSKACTVFIVVTYGDKIHTQGLSESWARVCSLQARASACSVEAQQLVSHDADAKLRPLIIELINRSLQQYTLEEKSWMCTFMAKMGNMEPPHIAKLVSSDVNEKLKPLPPSYQSPNTPHFQTLV
ncbi:unnamed protein product [Sphagnum troendelagicum]|uniref:Uncharacterized protein n=1 Tax=Sphagnum troendelagicum TaxID=128251 RepID=A0ABP0TGW9_9BRYO